MRQRILSVFVGIFFTTVLNAQISEQFSGKNLSSIWIGESSKFSIKDEKLQLSDEEQTGSAYLSTFSTAMDDASWECFLKMDFKPSGSNYVRYYLSSDSPVLNDALSGYYIQVGNADKQILLYRVKGTTSKKLGAGEEGRLDTTSISLNLKVIRSKSAEWKVYSKLNGEKQFTEEFSIVDSTFLTSSFSGLYCKYTKTNAQKISFDDIVVDGSGEKDAEKPFVSSFMPSDTLLTVTFSEWVNEDFLKMEITPSLDYEASWNNAHTKLSISLNETLLNGEKYLLKMSGIQDFVKNKAGDTTLVFAHVDEVSQGDILFTEVMFVPNTDGSEFVEIYNNSDKVLDLSELKFSTRKSADSSLYSSKKIANSVCLIFPGEIKVLTNSITGVTNFYHSDLNAFVELSSFPSLRNETGAIVLFRATDSLIIDNFYYENTMHEESVPNKGKGVSLERISLTSDVWISAAEINGYATPGFWKEGSVPEPQKGSSVSLNASEICFPYYDENHHFHLNYAFDVPNFLATVKIYDMRGLCVRTLLNNVSLDVRGDLVWDGTDDNGCVLGVAPYIVRFEAIQGTTGDRVRDSFVVLVSR